MHALAKNNVDWSQYKIWLSSLKCLANKIDFIDIEKSYFIRSWLINIIDAVEQDWYPYVIDRYGYYMRIKLPTGVSRVVFDCDYWINKNAVIHRMFDDKIICWDVLRSNQIPTPRSFLWVKENTLFSDWKNNIQSAIKFVEKVWYPLIMKPINWSQWRWVKKIINQEHLIDEINKFDSLWNWVTNLMLQEFVAWNDIRVIYLDGNIELAYQRIPATVVGDWCSTIIELIGNDKFLKHKNSIEEYLLREWRSIEDILENWEILQYVPTANVSTWWSVVKYDFDEEDVSFIKSIWDKLWARYFGADILTQWKISQGTVLELNKMPGTVWANSVELGFSKKLWSKIWKIIKKDEWIS